MVTYSGRSCPWTGPARYLTPATGGSAFTRPGNATSPPRPGARARELAGQLNKPRTSAQILWQLGAVRRAQGALRDADALLGDALAAIRAVADPRGEARILIEIGDLRAQVGDPGAAINALEASLKISREVRAWNFEALALESLSRIAEGADRLDSARDLLTAASDLWHELGDETRADVAAHHLAEISSSDQ